jgi:hypothetical protein
LPRKFAILAVTLLAIGFFPLVRQHLGQIWSNPMYQFYPFLLACVGFFGWRRWREAKGTTGPRAGYSCAGECCLVALAVALLTLAVAVYNPWLAAAACMPGLAAGVLVAERHRHVAERWGLWALLLLVIPPPLRLADDFAVGMQRGSSALSSDLLDRLKVDHVLRGNIIQLPSKDLFVDQACSGLPARGSQDWPRVWSSFACVSRRRCEDRLEGGCFARLSVFRYSASSITRIRGNSSSCLSRCSRT